MRTAGIIRLQDVLICLIWKATVHVGAAGISGRGPADLKVITAQKAWTLWKAGTGYTLIIMPGSSGSEDENEKRRISYIRNRKQLR